MVTRSARQITAKNLEIKLERTLKVSLKDIKIHLWKDNLLSLTIPNWNTQQNLHSIGSIYKNDPNAYEAENMGLKEII